MSSGFVSEAEIADQRRIRQEEWERVRTADQPAEVPEEQYDPRSLYDRLQEQKNKRDSEYEEAHKLKNMIKGLDDDEVEFLDLIDRNKLAEERKKHVEEAKEMRDFKAAVASLQEKSMDERLKQELKNPQSAAKSNCSGSGKNSQVRLLAGVVVKKPNAGLKRKLSEEETVDVKEARKSCEQSDATPQKESDSTSKDAEQDEPVLATDPKLVGMKCIGILPGMGCYDNSSESQDSSSDSEPEPQRSKFDMLGRKLFDVEIEMKRKDKS